MVASKHPVKRDASKWIALFDDRSPSYHEALTELPSVMMRVGFLVGKKAPLQATLRAYIHERLTYPLLDPRFVHRKVRGIGGRAYLEIAVLSKVHDSLDHRLSRFPKSRLAVFRVVAEMRRPYFVHGHFLLPLHLQDGSNHLTLDTLDLEPGLREVIRYFG